MDSLRNQLLPGRSHSFSDECAQDPEADMRGYLKIRRGAGGKAFHHQQQHNHQLYQQSYQQSPRAKTSTSNYYHTSPVWEAAWFKIKRNALFLYKGSEDSAPAETLALIGWNVEFVDVGAEKTASRAWYLHYQMEFIALLLNVNEINVSSKSSHQ